MPTCCEFQPCSNFDILIIPKNGILKSKKIYVSNNILHYTSLDTILQMFSILICPYNPIGFYFP